jgi:hypothetical protein
VTGSLLPLPTPSAQKHLDAVNGNGMYLLCYVVQPRSHFDSPYKANPNYKGKWYAPLIDNPAYKGEWAPRKIPNPDYFEDLTPVKSLSKIVSQEPTSISQLHS